MSVSKETRAILERLEAGHVRTAGRLGERSRRRIFEAHRPAWGTGAHAVFAAADEARKAAHYALEAMALREALGVSK